jgi:hypothetical protein
MQYSKCRAAVPTTLAGNHHYKIFFASPTRVVGTLGCIPALHTNNVNSIILQPWIGNFTHMRQQGRNKKEAILK